MVLTDEMKNAFQLIEDTTENLFITGKAGTGKTTLLKYLVENTHKNLVVTAPTGVAAINAGGVTLHSLFGIPFEVLGPNTPIKGSFYRTKASMFRKIDTIVIDEVSMVRPDVLDYIDRKLKLYRGNDIPFGGIQIVFFGDLFQLPPVTKKEEAEILKTWYPGYYFFYSFAIRRAGFKVIELTHVFRQHEEKFINILNRIREYKLLSIDIEDLSSLRDNRKSKDYDNNTVHICSLRRDADKINKTMMGEPTHSFPAVFEKSFKAQQAPCAVDLKLRVGARVMTLINDYKQGFYNGSMGTVSNIGTSEIKVLLDEGHEVTITPHTWKNHEYVLKNDKVEAIEKGTCTQFPLALGWAITIHKSQGLTFDNVTIHCPYVFAPGMLYVALSRCTSMEGIVTDFFISKKSIVVDHELMVFNQVCREAGKFDRGRYKVFCNQMGYEDN